MNDVICNRIMKRSILILFIAVLSASIYAQEFKFDYKRDYERVAKASKDNNSKLFYPALMQKFLDADTSMTDYQTLAMMIGFTKQEEYKPETIKLAESKIYAFNEKGDFENAKLIEDDLLIRYPLTTVGLIEKAYTSAKLEDLESMDLYGKRFRQLMKAMIFSGDGKSPETAIFALSVNDARNFVKKVLKADVGLNGYLESKDGYYVVGFEAIFERDTDFDVEEGEDKNIYVERVFFNLNHAEAIKK